MPILVWLTKWLATTCAAACLFGGGMSRGALVSLETPACDVRVVCGQLFVDDYGTQGWAWSVDGLEGRPCGIFEGLGPGYYNYAELDLDDPPGPLPDWMLVVPFWIVTPILIAFAALLWIEDL